LSSLFQISANPGEKSSPDFSSDKHISTLQGESDDGSRVRETDRGTEGERGLPQTDDDARKRVFGGESERTGGFPERGRRLSGGSNKEMGEQPSSGKQRASLETPGPAPHTDDGSPLFSLSPGEKPTAAQLAEAARQYEEVESRYTNPDGTKTEGWMKAPNGKPTKLTERQWVQARTPNFKKWFGDWENDAGNASKAVDANGEPLVVFHGTNASFDVFDRRKILSNTGAAWAGLGFYFSSKETGALDSSADWYGSETGAFFLNMKKPFAVPDNDTELHNALLSMDKDIITTRGDKLADELAEGLSPLLRDMSPGRFTNALVNNGFDGVINGIEYVAFQPNQIKSAADNAGTFDAADSSILFQLAGERGAAALDAAEKAAVRMDSLNIARRMEETGKDAKAVRLATGWERGADGKWRYEIADIETTGKFKDLEQGQTLKLSKAVKDGELLKAYPQLKDINIKITGRGPDSAAGSWDRETKTIELSDYIPAYDKNGEATFDIEAVDNAFRGVLIHEIQHAIQEIEGFAAGDSAEGGYGNYRKSAGETEARNVQTRMGFTPEERRKRLLAETEDVAREDQIIITGALGRMDARNADNEGMDKEKEDNPLGALRRKAEGIANGAERARILAEIDSVEKLVSGKAVTGITGDEFKKDPAKDLRTQVVEYFNSIGGEVYREGAGTVLLNKDGAKSSIAHGMSRAKAASFKAVADIIKHGITIDRQTNWKGRGYDTEVIDAVIDIGGTDYIAEVIINKYKDGINEYYLHELEKKIKLQGIIQTGLVTGGPEASKLIIAQKLEKVKDNISECS
jgi:hypothetical protein